MLTVATWLWGNKYSRLYVEKLRAGVARNLRLEHRFVCVTDDMLGPWDIDRVPMTGLLHTVGDGCYTRLRMFDPAWRAAHGINGTLLCLDLDAVVTGELDPLASRKEPFTILHGGHFNPCPFNGSVMLINPGAKDIFTKFDVNEAEHIATADGTHRGTDQTYIAAKYPEAAVFTWRHGVFAYRKPGWPGINGGSPATDKLPHGARLVVFPGKKDPKDLVHESWVRTHWRL